MLTLLLCAPVCALASGPAVPPLTGRVVDSANLLDDWTRNKIGDELAGFEKQTGDQLVVVTLPDLGGYTIEEWGIALGRGWGIGQKGKNNGLLLMVAPNEHDVRIEVGYGLEGDLPDATANAIIQQIILPRFRAGDMAGGIAAGVDAIVGTLGGKPVAGLDRSQADGGSDQAAAAIPIVFVFFLAIFLLRNLRQRRYGVGYPYLGYPYIGGRGFGGGFSGGGFGGGFSGGGGSFGGGGASGHW